MNILFASSEIYPYAKSGGLADVSSSLPKAIAEYEKIISVMPLYSSVDLQKYDIKKTNISFSVELKAGFFAFEVYSCDGVYFLKNDYLFARGAMYGDYHDNNIRFGVFCHAVLEFVKLLKIEFKIIHINDWQTALIALLAKTRYGLDAKIVFTIHNLAYQGVFYKDTVDLLEMGWDSFTLEKFESYDMVNLLKGAVAYSDKITTVSKTYAKEILTREYGCMLENFLTTNSYKLEGILNGVDYKEFDPLHDANIYSRYDSVISKKKAKNKELLLEELGLNDVNRPLMVFIGRFTSQKGVELLLEMVHFLKDSEINIAIIGDGERFFVDRFLELSSVYKNLSITIGYNEALARRFYASADFLLMPSLYEPCGLNQMIAYRYGAVPIVRKTGGLADSVVDFATHNAYKNDIGVGVVFERADSFSILHAVLRALSLFCNKDMYIKTIKYNKTIDNSWSHRAKEYINIYKSLTKEG
ncbi:MAG: starch synthase [Campylobacterota bacterium]|nr:starch synthase [Campylobacterota bacterium]